jgi:hypothetical protein
MAHSNNKNMATASPSTEIMASFTACTPARGRHLLHFLPNERGTSSQQNLDRCNRRAKTWRLFGPNFKWEGATRGARLSGAVLFDPAPGGALVRAYTGHTKSICTRGAAKGKSVSCAIAHTGLDYSIVNMGSAICFSPNTHQQQHFATPFNAFRHTSSDAQNITLFFLRVPNLCRGTYANQLHSDVSWN